MKKFIVKIAIFAVVLYGFAWGLDYMISKGLQQMDDYRFMSWHEMQQGDINADIVILGNSKAFSHYEPWTIDSICKKSCYCLGIGGHPINIDIFKYHCYRAHNVKPKYILFDVNFSMMYTRLAPQEHESEQFLPLIYDKPMRGELKKIGYSVTDVYLPLKRYWGYQMAIKNGLLEFLGIKHYTKEPSRLGHHYETLPWDGTELSKMDSIDGEIKPDGKQMFEQFMQECRDENIEVILVNSPMYKGASEILTHKGETYAYFDSVAKSNGYVYWDYTIDYPLCNDTTNFCVSVHMNPSATHQFSVDLSNRLKEYLSDEE